MIECKINGRPGSDYGILLDETALSTLMTPAPNKDDVSNESRLEHGCCVLKNAPRRDKRTLSLRFTITASDRASLYVFYNKFCAEVLDTGDVNIETIYQPDVVYKCRYKSCEQLTYYNGKVAKFSLSLIEPNPADRTIETEE